VRIPSLAALLLVALVAQSQANEACPQRFSDFLKKFETNRPFQEARVRYPLAYRQPDVRCRPDCPPIRISVTPERVKASAEPLYPTLEKQKELSLEAKVQVNGRKASVRLDMKDSDAHSFEYLFERGPSCWQLVAVEDVSQ
jgi:hypothetical protein